jgi:integrase
MRARPFIRRGVQPVRGADRTSTIEFTPLKTKRARRQVQLPPFALKRVRRHRREQLKRRTALGPEWRDPVDEGGEPLAMVCDRGDGSPLYPDSFSSAFKRLARRAGLHPATRLHDMRHAVATELGRHGVHPVIVSAVLGHASPAFTIAVYQHAWQDGPAEAAQALEAALRPSPALAIRWHEMRSSRVETLRSSGNRRSEAWGGEDSNLRPTDYEDR